MTEMKDKKELRRQYLNIRAEMSKEDVVTNSDRIFRRLCAFKEYENATLVLAYMSFGNEVMTGDFIGKCLRDGKRVALPRVESTDGNNRILRVYEIKDLQNDTEEGFRGIFEPIPSVTSLVDPVQIDLAVIPGVAFDVFCNRLGYGAGYYDRFLPLLRTDCLKAGVAFESQIADFLPFDKHDFRLDLIVTEKRTIKQPQGKNMYDRKGSTDE